MIFAAGSSTFSLTGIGTRSSSFANSPFSSSRTGMYCEASAKQVWREKKAHPELLRQRKGAQKLDEAGGRAKLGVVSAH